MKNPSLENKKDQRDLQVRNVFCVYHFWKYWTINAWMYQNYLIYQFCSLKWLFSIFYLILFVICWKKVSFSMELLITDNIEKKWFESSSILLQNGSRQQIQSFCTKSLKCLGFSSYQDVTHKIVDAIGAIAGSSLEQTTWLRRNLEVKPSPKIMVDGNNLESDVEGSFIFILF